MCISYVCFFSGLYRGHVYIFNYREICAQVALVVLTCEEVCGVRTTKEGNFAEECVNGPQGSLLGNFDL